MESKTTRIAVLNSQFDGRLKSFGAPPSLIPSGTLIHASFRN
jgi:hypothetical protein